MKQFLLILLSTIYISTSAQSWNDGISPVTFKRTAGPFSFRANHVYENVETDLLTNHISCWEIVLDNIKNDSTQWVFKVSYHRNKIIFEEVNPLWIKFVTSGDSIIVGNCIYKKIRN